MLLRKILDIYIIGSVHVALSVYSLVRVTEYLFAVADDTPVAYFTFFGTIVGYNFVKYDFLVRSKRMQLGSKLKAIVVASFIAMCCTGYFFFQLALITKIVSVIVLILTLLYTLPFFPNRKNARNWAGVKIYIVSLCWVGVTVLLPILNSGLVVTADVLLISMQRFLLVFVLILIFEIIDLAKDDPHLMTVPQQIGVEGTRNLGYLLLAVFCMLEVFNIDKNLKYQFLPLLLRIGIAIITAVFLAFANGRRSKYYTSFWAEGIPVLWWLLLSLIYKF